MLELQWEWKQDCQESGSLPAGEQRRWLHPGHTRFHTEQERVQAEEEEKGDALGGPLWLRQFTTEWILH